MRGQSCEEMEKAIRDQKKGSWEAWEPVSCDMRGMEVDGDVAIRKGDYCYGVLYGDTPDGIASQEKIFKALNACEGLNPEHIPALVEAAKEVNNALKGSSNTRILVIGLGNALSDVENPETT